jgi:hypothetical protein
MKLIRKYLRSLAIIGGLIVSLNFVHAQTTARAVQSINAAPVDSIVRIVADSDGLSPLLPEEVPLYGTFWTVFPGLGGIPVPMPCPPLDPSFPIYTIADGQFLVDETGGVLPQPPGRQAMMGVSSATLIQTQVNMVLDLIGQVQEAQANTERRAMALDVPMPGDGGDGDTNAYTFNASGFTVDYSTNLWIRLDGVSSGNLVGIISNSPAAVKLELQSRSDLLQTNWDSAGFVYGSEVTNWTSWSVPMSSPSNLFLRIRSWADDGSGLPIWWQMQYFGIAGGVDPYGNPAGDGWNNLQKFQNGMNPNIFYTPPAPQMSASFNVNNGMATVSWLPSPGPVTGYTLEKYDYQTGQTTDYNFSANQGSFEDDLSSDTPDFDYSPKLYVNYQAQAHYAGGDSAWGFAQIQNIPGPTFNVIPGAQGNLCLAMQGLPSDLSAIRVFYLQPYGVFLSGSYDNFVEWESFPPGPANNFVISATNVVNGICPLPTSQIAPFGTYKFWVQTVRSNGVDSGWTGPIYAENDRLVDARNQLKDNLRFILRSAPDEEPFGFTAEGYYSFYVQVFRTWPANYVYAGFYSHFFTGSGFSPEIFDSLEPVEDNYFYRNFVFDVNNLASDGSLDTGCYFKFNNGNLYIPNYPEYYLNLAGIMAETNPVVASSLLTTNQTRWILPPKASDASTNVSVNDRNIYGLAYQSVENAQSISNQLIWGTYAPGASISGGYFYREAAQPNFQLVHYYFARPNTDPMPEQNDFSPTNTTPLMIISVKDSLRIAGYAQLSVQNAYSGVYAYLGQYFDQAYTEDANGIATTNTTGILSPYGSFFATEPGPAALVTMPDVDTGARGTCTVYCVSLQLDRNHDGNMDLSFSGPDATSQNSPYIFWCDSNFDRWHIVDGSDLEQDDVQQGEDGSIYNLDPNDPDYNYKDLDRNRVIPCKRDLEDFARLWVCGVTSNLLAALPSGSTVTFSWGDVGNPNSGNPTIDLFAAADPDGGIGYLTNSTIASHQIDPMQGQYIGRLGPGSSIQLNNPYLPILWAGDRFIWCGVTNGSGQLTLTIADANSNVLAQTSQWIQIKDIKQMYERWTVGDNPKVAPTNTAQLAGNDLPDPTQPPFQYAPNTDTNTPYILFVHGWNLPTWGKDRFAETAYKRLYWQGYKGRFGLFRWPTLYDFPAGEMSRQAWNPDNFDTSEMQSWQAGAGLQKLLVQLNNEYPGQVRMFAHSHGNIAAGEALRTNVTLVHTYVAMQAAVPSHAYDPSTTNRPLNAWGVNLDSLTPERTAQYWTNGAPCYFNSNDGAANVINFFNSGDWALNWWLKDQDLKPDAGYEWQSVGTNAPELYTYTSPLLQVRSLYFPTNTYEIFSYITEGRCYAVGQQANVGGIFDTNNQVNLASGPYNLSTTHKFHSAEFRSDNMSRAVIWNAVLQKMGLKQ